MNTFYWLVKRELWEHRGSFLWAPVLVAGIILLLSFAATIAAWVMDSGMFHDFGTMQEAFAAQGGHLQNLGWVFDFMALMPMTVICITLFIVLLGYCMRTLSSDRQDRSILFWKSLPLSDLTTVLSKAFCAIVVAPVAAVVVGAIAALLSYLFAAIVASFHGIGFGQALWGLPHPGRTVGGLFSLLPIYMLWMLPTVGWLMLCSAWSKCRRVGRWAFGLPFGLYVVLSWLQLFGLHVSGWFFQHVALRLTFSVIPGSWLLTEASKQQLLLVGMQLNGGPESSHMATQQLFEHIGAQYHLLVSPNFLWGILAGVVMLALAVWLRRWRTEL